MQGFWLKVYLVSRAYRSCAYLGLMIQSSRGIHWVGFGNTARKKWCYVEILTVAVLSPTLPV